VVCITEGFNFLGFKFQRFHRRNGDVRKFVYQPNPERVRTFAEKLAVQIKRSLSVDVKEMIQSLNRQIIGFCNYFRWSNAHRMFGWLSTALWTLLWRWARRKHPTRGRRWLRNRYWAIKNGSKWVFSWEGVDLVSPYRLGVKWWKYPILRIDTSPYDISATEYWKNRRRLIKALGVRKILDHVVIPRL
jgi:RNA-directed DNA polymerase